MNLLSAAAISHRGVSPSSAMTKRYYHNDYIFYNDGWLMNLKFIYIFRSRIKKFFISLSAFFLQNFITSFIRDNVSRIESKFFFFFYFFAILMEEAQSAESFVGTAKKGKAKHLTCKQFFF